MTGFRANAVVCESVREEVSGQFTLVGVYPPVVPCERRLPIPRSTYVDLEFFNLPKQRAEIRFVSNGKIEADVNLFADLNQIKEGHRIVVSLIGPSGVPRATIRFQVLLLVDDTETELTSVLFEVVPDEELQPEGAEPAL